MDKFDLAQYNHSNIQELIRFIDQKAGALVAIYGIIMTAFIDFAKELKFINPFGLDSFIESIISILTFIMGIILLGFLLNQVYIILFQIIKPKMAKNYTQEEASVLYFEHISKMSKSEFISLYQSNNQDDFFQKELLAQVYECSCILREKSEKLNVTISNLFKTIILLLVYIFLTQVL